MSKYVGPKKQVFMMWGMKMKTKPVIIEPLDSNKTAHKHKQIWYT